MTTGTTSTTLSTNTPPELTSGPWSNLLTWWPAALFLGVILVLAILTGRGIKFGKLEISGRKSTVDPEDIVEEYDAARDRWELTVLSGFQDYIRDSNTALKNFLSRDVDRFFVQSFIAVLKEKGVDHENIRHHLDVIRYEDILGLSVRKIVIPRFLTIFFRNHIPAKTDLQSDDRRVRESAERWFVNKRNDALGDSQDFIAKAWPVRKVSHEEVREYYTPLVGENIHPALIDMFETVRQKREIIFNDMREEIPDINTFAVTKRWEELFILMGYNDILEG